MFCKNCGKWLSPNERFCARCGTENNLSNRDIGKGIPNSAMAWDSATKRIWIKPAIAVVVALAVFVAIIIGCNARSSNSPEKAIEAYYSLLSDGDLEGLSELIPKQKQEAIENLFQDAWGVEYADWEFDDIFSPYADWLEEHSTEEFVYDYYDDEGGVWTEMASGLEDYLIYEKGNIELEIEDEEKTDILSLISESLKWDLDNYYSDDDDLFDSINHSEILDGYDSESVVKALEYDNLMCCNVKIKSKVGTGRNTDTLLSYVYKYDGKWWSANVLIYFYRWLMEESP